MLAQLEEEYRGRVDFISYNTWEERGKVSEYGITVTPTLVFLDESGKVISRLVGWQSPENLRHQIDRLLGE